MVDVVIFPLLNVLEHAIVHVYVNDGIGVSVWQDGAVEKEPLAQTGTEPGQPDPDGTPDVRAVENVDVLRALADPTRLAILGVLMDQRDELPVMSVKELAARLGEPQTKLYRHVRQLEAVGLIRVAATRMVSGILEQRYQACQRDLLFDSGFLRAHADDSEAAFAAMLDNFRTGFFAAFRNPDLAPGQAPDSERYRQPAIFAAEIRVSPARATEIRSVLREAMTRISDGQSEDPDGIPVTVLIGYYTGAEPETGPDRG
jgi:DNA-binding transcriptional ArsR family regulator